MEMCGGWGRLWAVCNCGLSYVIHGCLKVPGDGMPRSRAEVH